MILPVGPGLLMKDLIRKHNIWVDTQLFGVVIVHNPMFVVQLDW